MIRSVNQDECQPQVLKEFDISSVLVVLDWAMQYLPRQFRESQTDWFAKSGFPWHITIASRRADNNMEMMTFVHLFEASNQIIVMSLQSWMMSFAN